MYQPLAEFVDYICILYTEQGDDLWGKFEVSDNVTGDDGKVTVTGELGVRISNRKLINIFTVKNVNFVLPASTSG